MRSLLILTLLSANYVFAASFFDQEKQIKRPLLLEKSPRAFSTPEKKGYEKAVEAIVPRNFQFNKTRKKLEDLDKENEKRKKICQTEYHLVQYLFQGSTKKNNRRYQGKIEETEQQECSDIQLYNHYLEIYLQEKKQQELLDIQLYNHYLQECLPGNSTNENQDITHKTSSKEAKRRDIKKIEEKYGYSEKALNAEFAAHSLIKKFYEDAKESKELDQKNLFQIQEELRNLIENVNLTYNPWLKSLLNIQTFITTQEADYRKQTGKISTEDNISDNKIISEEFKKSLITLKGAEEMNLISTILKHNLAQLTQKQ